MALQNQIMKQIEVFKSLISAAAKYKSPILIVFISLSCWHFAKKMDAHNRSKLREKLLNQPPLPLAGESQVRIRVWRASGGVQPRRFGHVSIEIKNHYISLWPLGVKSVLFKSNRHFKSNYEDDFGEESKDPPEFVVSLYGLDAKKMELTFASYRKQVTQWSLLGPSTPLGRESHSCASLVYDVLRAGGIENLMFKPACAVREHTYTRSFFGFFKKTYTEKNKGDVLETREYLNEYTQHQLEVDKAHKQWEEKCKETQEIRAKHLAELRNCKCEKCQLKEEEFIVLAIYKKNKELAERIAEAKADHASWMRMPSFNFSDPCTCGFCKKKIPLEPEIKKEAEKAWQSVLSIQKKHANRTCDCETCIQNLPEEPVNKMDLPNNGLYLLTLRIITPYDVEKIVTFAKKNDLLMFPASKDKDTDYFSEHYHRENPEANSMCCLQ